MYVSILLTTSISRGGFEITEFDVTLMSGTML